jgi:hypothetical protein
MPTGRKSRGRKKRGWFSRDSRRAFGICLFFGALAVAAVGTVFPQAPTALLRGMFAGKAAIQTDDDDLATGSIIFVPILGNVCRKRLIDNATWQIRESGLVDCRAALNPSAPQPGWSGARVDVIRSGFYKR